MGLPSFNDGVVDPLAFLGTNISRVLGDDLCWVEHVIAQRIDEREHEGGLGRLFGLRVVEEIVDASGDRA